MGVGGFSRAIIAGWPGANLQVVYRLRAKGGKLGLLGRYLLHRPLWLASYHIYGYCRSCLAAWPRSMVHHPTCSLVTAYSVSAARPVFPIRA